MPPAETREAMAKRLAARDHVLGPPVWEPSLIERRWAELDLEQQSHYLWMAEGAAEGLAEIGKPVM